MKTTSITKNEGGRPTKITDEVVAKLENVFKAGATIEQACSYAGINKSTYYRRIEADGGFATKMEAAQYYSDIIAKNIVIESIVKDKDLNSAKWWLEKREFKNTGNNVAVQVNLSQKLDEQRNKYGV